MRCSESYALKFHREFSSCQGAVQYALPAYKAEC